MKSIGFEKITPDWSNCFYKEEEEGIPLYFRCINSSHPAWIIQASLISLSLGDVNLAARLSEFALKTNEFIKEVIYGWWFDFDEHDWWCSGEYFWSQDALDKCRDDLRKMNKKWARTQDILIHNAKSLIALAEGNLKQAVEWISYAIHIKDAGIADRLLKETSVHAVLYSNRGVFYLDMQEYTNALADFTKAIELDPFQARHYAHRGLVYLILKEYRQALEDYNKALELNPNNLEFYRQRALCHLCHHSLELASSDLLLVESIENQKRCENNEIGLDFFGKGEFEQSLQPFNQLIQANPAEPIAYQNRGAAHYQLGHLDLAIDDFDRALQLAPQKEELYAMRGAAYLLVSHFEEAQKDLLTAVQLNPEGTAAYKNLAALYYATDDLDEALNYCLKVLSYSSNDPEMLRDLALIYFLQENYAEALTYCNKLSELGEATTTIYLVRGLCLFENHQFEDAIRSYDHAIESDPSLSQAYFNRGQAYYCLLNLEKAWSDFNQAIELDSANPALYKSRGLVLLNLQREEEAYQDFFTAIKLASLEKAENEEKDQMSLSFGSMGKNLRLFGSRA